MRYWLLNQQYSSVEKVTIKIHESIDFKCYCAGFFSYDVRSKLQGLCKRNRVVLKLQSFYLLYELTLVVLVVRWGPGKIYQVNGVILWLVRKLTRRRQSGSWFENSWNWLTVKVLNIEEANHWAQRRSDRCSSHPNYLCSHGKENGNICWAWKVKTSIGVEGPLSNFVASLF